EDVCQLLPGSMHNELDPAVAYRDLVDPLEPAEGGSQAGQVPLGREPDPVLAAHHGHQFGSAALSDQAPVIEDSDAVAQALRLLHVVGGVEDREALGAESLDVVEDGRSALGVDADGRLIEHEQPGPVEEPGGDVQPTLHTARVLLHSVVSPVSQAAELETRLQSLVPLTASQPVQAREEAQVLPTAEIGVEGDLLGYVADGRLRLGSALVDRLAGHHYLARVCP